MLQNIDEDGSNGVAMQGLPGPLGTNEHVTPGDASLALETDNVLRRLSAVVDDDDRLEVDAEEEGSDEDADDDDEAYMHAREMGRRAGRRFGHHSMPRPAAGPELTSYIYGHVRSFLEALWSSSCGLTVFLLCYVGLPGTPRNSMLLPSLILTDAPIRSQFILWIA